MIDFLSFIFDNLFGLVNRGKCPEQLIKTFYTSLVNLGFEVHNDYNLTETELFKLGKGDCEDRSLVLARFMVRQGCKGVKLLYMSSIDPDEPGHVCVISNGYAYDPTMDYYKYPDWNYKSIMKSYKDFKEVKVFW
jgi:hypothetical protein